MKEHQDGYVHSTQGYAPFVLVAYIAVSTERTARDLESYCKTGSGKAFFRKRILTDEAASQASSVPHSPLLLVSQYLKNLQPAWQ